MAKVITDSQNYTNIANAIREKNGEETTYKPSEMAEAITDISSGTIEALEITENGTYTASEDVDGYSPITVNVPDSVNIFNTSYNLSSSSTAIREIYSYTAKKDGIFRPVFLSVYTNVSSLQGYLQILKNGVVVESSGTVRSSTLTNINFNNIDVVEGDVISVQTNWTGTHTDCYWYGEYCYACAENVPDSYLEKIIKFVGIYNAGCGNEKQTFNATVGKKYLAILVRCGGSEAGISSGAEVDTVLIDNLRNSESSADVTYIYVAIIKATDTTVTALGTKNLALYIPL